MDSLSQKLLAELKNSPFWTNRTRMNERTIQGLICPECADTSAWAYGEEPNAICCNKLGQCGKRTRTLDLFPQVRQNIERDFPATKTDLHRPAREYILSRGISEDIFKDLNFRYLKNARNSGSGAVIFFVGTDNKGKEVFNGRLFNPPPGEGKSHFIGSSTGKIWKHPGYTYQPENRTWIVEGIFDALSLLMLGEQAIAVLSAGQDPNKTNLSEFKKLVISFDNDEAGKRACKKWKAVFPEADVLLADPGQDWNSALLSGPFEQVKAQFKTNQARYRHNGKLALAESAHQYAEIWSDFHGFPPDLFHFNGCTYYSEKKQSRDGKQPSFVITSRCIKAVVHVISFIIDRSNPARPQFIYNLEINPAKGRPLEVIATGSDLANPRKLKEWFLTYGKLTWEGDARSATAFCLSITDNKKAPEVRQLSITGYQADTSYYIFSSWGIDSSGKELLPDKRGNFKTGHNCHYKVPAHAEEKAIRPASISMKLVKETYGTFKEAWGLNGIVALSWTIAGLFVNQIKEALDFFPFLSLYGDPATGKSALVRTLNYIQGRNLEGIPITQLNSRKGLTRTIGQLSGQFSALLEDSVRNEKGFV